LLLAAFVLLSIPAIVVSLPSFRRPRSYGLFRFFGFEGTLLLVLLNLDNWFAEPFSPLHLSSWIVLSTSLVLALHSFHMLRTRGRPAQGSVETTTRLVTAGAYRFIRHPLYASLLLLAFGAFLKGPSWSTAGLLALTAASFHAAAVAEERESLARFGDSYSHYMRRTRMFIPHVF
jgi:protein-S-isoprenylcysteine O-methyltransferase Ste14